MRAMKKENFVGVSNKERKSRKLVSIMILFIVLILSLPAVGRAGPADKGVSKKNPSVKDDKVLINLVDAELPVLVKFISDLTGISFFYDERLRGKVTIYSPDKLSKDDAYRLFVSVLEFKGFTIINSDNIKKIIPIASLKGDSFEVLTDKRVKRPGASFVARVIPLEHINATSLIALIRPLVNKNAFIAPFQESNSVFLLDTMLNIKKILKIVKSVDIPLSKSPPELVFLEYADPARVVDIIASRKPGARGGVPSGGSPASAISTGPIVDKRLNAVIIFGTDTERAAMKVLIAIVDVPTPQAKSGINVYHLENANAEEVAKVLTNLNSSMQAGGRPGTVARAPGAAGRPSGTPLKSASALSGNAKVTSYMPTNSLIIQASSDDYLSLVEIIKELDKRPKQVFVEAMIMEVSVNKAMNVGAKWRAMSEKNNKPVVIGGVGSVTSSTVGDILTGLAGLSIGGVTNFMTFPVLQADGSTKNVSVPGLTGLFSMEAFKDVINVLSTPQILTSDNKEAEIIVGENVPFLSQFERGSTTTDQPILQSIERKDVGITLRITPQISDGGYVKLDIYQEISAVAPTVQAGGVGAADIITTKRSARTTVVVKDRQKIVIGGLIQDKKSVNVTKVPLLGDIPILGLLFKFKRNRTEKTNLIVFLKPIIIDDFDDLDRLKNERKEIFSSKLEEEDVKTFKKVIDDEF